MDQGGRNLLFKPQLLVYMAGGSCVCVPGATGQECTGIERGAVSACCVGGKKKKGEPLLGEEKERRLVTMDGRAGRSRYDRV